MRRGQAGRDEPVAVAPDHERRHPHPRRHRPQRLAAPPARDHRLRGAVERLVRPGQAGCAARSPRPPRRAGARARAAGRRSTAAPPARRASRGSSRRARRGRAAPRGRAAAASTSRGSDTRRGSGRRSGIAGETSVSVAPARDGGPPPSSAIAPPSELPSRCTGRPRPARKHSSASACAGRACSRAPAGGREQPEPGQVDGGARGARAPSSAGEVGPVGGRAGQSVHVDGRRPRGRASRARAASPRPR